MRQIREIHAKSAQRDAIELEESIWIEMVRGCALSPPSERQLLPGAGAAAQQRRASA